MKKLIALVLALAMVATLGLAFAANDGSISVTNATKGQTYEAFLIFTASPSDPDDVTQNIIYTATSSQIAVSGFGDVFDTIVDANGNYTISKKSSVSDDAVISYIKAHLDDLKQGSAISGTWADNDTITFSGLAYGYYYISSSLGSLVTIDTAGKNISVYDKNESTPTGPDKKITDENSSIDSSLGVTDVSVPNNKAAVGSVESFKVTFNATNWVKSDDAQTAGSGSQGTKVTEWNFIDTPTGLAIEQSSVKIKVNGNDVTSTVGDIAVNSSTGVLTFTIPWVDANGKHLYATQSNGSELIPVEVTYNATVTDAAATAIAPNEVEVKYNNETRLGNKVTTETYTYKFKLLKVDENSAALVGAEFELYFGDTVLHFEKISDGVYHYNSGDSNTHIAPVGDNAQALIYGLDDGTYTLKEVVVPAGYNKAADRTVSGLSRVDVADASATTITVQNNKGLELPSTGGIGTTIFYVLGGLLVVGAAVILVARRKAHD